MTQSTRPRGITVKVLDTAALEAEALAFRQATNPTATSVSIYGGPWAIVEAGGQLFAICHEGVGPALGVTDKNPLEVDFHAQYTEDGKESFDIVPFGSAKISATDLRSLPVKEEADLADFVRVFGSRLERNFWGWYHRLAV